MNGAEALIQTAVNAGVNHCFANPGTTEIDIVDAFDTGGAEIRCVLGLFEGVCTGMADGYARMTGGPAMTLLHLGVGLGNGIANLHNARRARSPIVNIIGDHPSAHLPYDAPLTSDIATMAEPVSHRVMRIGSSTTVSADVAEAIACVGGSPGRIVTLIAPADAMRESANGALVSPVAQETASVNSDAVESVAKILKGDSRVALLVAGVALQEEGLRLVSRIASATGCHAFGHGFPGRMDRGAGLPAVERLPYFPEAILERLADVDHLILVGAVAPVAFFSYPEYPSSLVPEGCQALTLCPPDENPVPYLDALVGALDAPESGVVITERNVPEIPNGALNSKSLGAAVACALPEDAIISDESFTEGGPTFHLTRTAARHTSMYVTGGGIGMGLPVATGAAVACPDRPVLALHGDGGGMMTFQALWTQAREGLNVTNVILSNRKYQILQVEQARAGTERPGPIGRALTELTNPEIDWCSLAKGLGVPASRPESADALYADLQRGFAESGPSLIEVLL